MVQKLLKHELVERLLQLKEIQDLLTVQMQLLAQEISELQFHLYRKHLKASL
jgi:hypothetical protein